MSFLRDRCSLDAPDNGSESSTFSPSNPAPWPGCRPQLSGQDPLHASASIAWELLAASGRTTAERYGLAPRRLPDVRHGEAMPTSIQFPYTPHKPNAGITLYQGQMSIRQDRRAARLQGPGRIDVVWIPSSGIQFEITINGGSLSTNIGKAVYLTWGSNSSRALVLYRGHQSGRSGYTETLRGFLLPPTKYGGKPSRTLLFGVVNFPKWRNPQGEIEFSLGDWQISMADSTPAIYDQLRADGGFCITNVGLAQRGGSPASAREVYRLLDELALLFSLARGSWACPFLPVSFCRTGARIWEEWALRNVDTWKGHFSWFPPFHPDALASVATGLHSRWSNPIWTEPLEVAIHLYVESNSGGLARESSLILGQTALELLSWTYFVVDQKLYSASQFDGLWAAERIRKLLKTAKIPTAIPRQLGSLAASGAWANGPHAITAFRNALVHPPRLPSLLTKPSQARLQAWQLTLWYLERAFLWLLGYSGHYCNRLRRYEEEVI